MREPDGTQLPLVRAFGEQLERAIANRAGSPGRSQRRVLAVACAAGLVAVSLMTAPGRAASGLVGYWLGLAKPGNPPTVQGSRPRGELHKQPLSSSVFAAGRAPIAPATSSCSTTSRSPPSQLQATTPSGNA